MKRLATIAALLTIAACQQQPSKLDTVAADKAGPGAAPAAAVVADHSGDVESRLRRLEDSDAKHAEAMAFLEKVYAQQKQQQKQQAREEHDPNAMFAVDIGQNVRAGHVEGPQGALVTIIEAWDFA